MSYDHFKKKIVEIASTVAIWDEFEINTLNTIDVTSATARKQMSKESKMQLLFMVAAPT